MNNRKTYSRFGFFALVLLAVTACSNIFEPSFQNKNNDSVGKNVVRIFVGENTARERTIQPGKNDIAGYRFTVDNGTYTPVDVTGQNYADINLADGTWTVTATAYKSGGTIGNSADAVASGSIAITVSGGSASGTVPNIILKPIGTDTGTLSYAITPGTGTGYMKLCGEDGVPVSGFGSGGELAITGSVTATSSIAAGRYIAEVKLADGAGKIAFRREAVEIWAGTTTSFAFSPATYIDPYSFVTTAIPEDLKGHWKDYEDVDISGTEFSAQMGGYGGYKGTIVGHRSNGSAGYITIQYTVNDNDPSAVGKYYVIYYENLTATTVSYSGAYSGTDPDFAYHKSGGKASQAEAEAAYTILGGYFGMCTNLEKIVLVSIPNKFEGTWTYGSGSTANAFAITDTTIKYIYGGMDVYDAVIANVVDNGATGYIVFRFTYIYPSMANAALKDKYTVLYWESYSSPSVSFAVGGGNTTWSGFLAAPNLPSSTSIDEAEDTYINTAFSFNRRTFTQLVLEPAATLTSAVWTGGSLANASDIDRYKFAVSSGTTYYVWWNDKGQGDDTKTGDVEVMAYYSDGSAVSSWSSYTDSGWTTAKSFSSTKNGTVYLLVRPKNSNAANVGNYSIAFRNYNIMSGTESSVASAVPLTNGVWKDDGSLANAGDIDVYLITVFQGTTYYVWWNDKYVGDGTKTSDIQVYAAYSDESLIFGPSSSFWADSAWTTPQSFTAAKNGIVYIRVRPYSGTIANIGTYGIVYSTNSVRPGSPVPNYASAVTLTNGVWTDGELTGANSLDVYQFTVTANTTYYLWWNQGSNASRGNQTKTAQVHVRAEDSSHNVILDWQDNGWTTGNQLITPDFSGTVYLIVRPYNEMGSYIGTYAIVYSTSNASNPPIIDTVTLNSVTPVGSPTTTELTLTFDKAIAGLSAADITLTPVSGASFGVSKGTLSGSGPVYTLPISFPVGGTLDVAVAKVLYTINGSPKQATITGGTSVALVEDTWANGNLPSGSSVDWYTITVTNATTYYVWWNDKDQGPTPKDKTADVDVIAYYSDGSAISGWTSAVDAGWNTAKSFTASQNGTVLVRVRPYNAGNNYVGTYGIVYSTGNTRPE